MIRGLHGLCYSSAPEEMRTFQYEPEYGKAAKAKPTAQPKAKKR